MNMAATLKKAVDWWGERRIARLKTLIASVPEGRALLALADKENLPVYFDWSMMRQGLAGELRDGMAGPRLDTPHRGIALNPFLGKKYLTGTLAHELRHFWQLRQLAHPEKLSRMTFENAIGFLRVMEGDAFAFQNYMAVRIHAATGVKLHFDLSPDTRAPYRFPLAEPPLPANADSREMMKTLFDNFQASHMAESYDRRVIGLFRQVAAHFQLKAADDAETAAQLQADNGLLRFFFNKASFDEVGDIRRLMRHGVDDTAPSYTDAPDNDSVLQAVYAAAQGREMQQVRKNIKPDIAPPPAPVFAALPQ